MRFWASLHSIRNESHFEECSTLTAFGSDVFIRIPMRHLLRRFANLILVSRLERGFQVTWIRSCRLWYLLMCGRMRVAPSGATLLFSKYENRSAPPRLLGGNALWLLVISYISSMGIIFRSLVSYTSRSTIVGQINRQWSGHVQQLERSILDGCRADAYLASCSKEPLVCGARNS